MSQEMQHSTDQQYLKDPEVALSFLKKAIERLQTEGDAEVFLIALHKLTKLRTSMSNLSRETGINRQSLYRTFASNGNPKLKSLVSILEGLGYRLTIEPIPTTDSFSSKSSYHHEDNHFRNSVEEEDYSMVG